ncbi:hypothetical protein NQ317_014387 [Molorchus minor]|uniref:Small ribosomal subunit protein uS4 N-terminal domain-containing protein n=1 Tax=Molorchus minor TaxID=1323400 RepID=A0ABQ9K6U4_9CUCU|nr:hypothetical protein NQ317_014387 [Molorchus minor]
MVRKLKYHEQKLLKKVDFISWEVDNNLHEVKVLKKYHIQKKRRLHKVFNGPYPYKMGPQLSRESHSILFFVDVG